eukprot:118845-Chlamydomonas_euryale.AAC.6
MARCLPVAGRKTACSARHTYAGVATLCCGSAGRATVRPKLRETNLSGARCLVLEVHNGLRATLNSHRQASPANSQSVH